MREEAPPTVGVVEVQDQACGSWSGKNGTQLLLAILIGRARARVVAASSSHEIGKTGVPSTLSATPAGVTSLPRAKLFITLTRSTGEAATTLVCDWCDADTCDSPSIGVPNEGAESLTKREFHFFVLLEFDVCCQLLMLRFRSPCQCVQRHAT